MSQSRIVFVRHGQTQANLSRVWHGHIDTPLTDFGRVQARLAGEYLGEMLSSVAAVYASPLQRARHTAQAIANPLGLEVTCNPLLVEFGVGEWEGRGYEELDREFDLLKHLTRDPDYSPPGGESVRSVAGRMTEVIESLSESHRNETIVVVSHGMALSLLFARLLHNDTSRWTEYHCHNTGISEASFSPFRLLRFNSTEHLERLATSALETA